MEVANGVVSKIESLDHDNASKKDEIKNLKKEINSLRLAAELEANMSAAEEERSEAATLQKLLEDRENTITFLERESKMLKQANAESEMKVRDLERKLSVYEVKLSEECSKRVRVEEEMEENVGDREREIQVLKQRIEELENVEMRNEEGESEEEIGFGLGLAWPVVAAGCGVVAAVFYFCFRKRTLKE